MGKVFATVRDGVITIVEWLIDNPAIVGVMIVAAVVGAVVVLKRHA